MIAVDEEEGTKERKMEEKGIFGISLGRKRSGGNRKEKVVAAREKLLVVASCPGKVHLAWQLLETVRYLVRQHLFGLRAAWTFENCP